jgi:hypothetical protein
VKLSPCSDSAAGTRALRVVLAFALTLAFGSSAEAAQPINAATGGCASSRSAALAGVQATLAQEPLAYPPCGSGVQATRVTYTGDGSTNGSYGLGTSSPLVSSASGGTTYTAGAWVEGTATSAGELIEITLQEERAGTQIGQASSAPITLASAHFQRLSVSYVARSSGDSIEAAVVRPYRVRTGEAFIFGGISAQSGVGGNLVANPSFQPLPSTSAAFASGGSSWGSFVNTPWGWETSYASLTATGSGAARMVSLGPFGYAIKTRPVVDAVGAGGPTEVDAQPALWPDMRYTATVWAEAAAGSAGRPVELQIVELRHGREVGAGLSDAVALPSTRFTRLVASYAPGYSGDQLEFSVLRPPPSAVGESILVADPSLTHAPIPPSAECPQQFGAFAVGNWPPACFRPYGPSSIFNMALPANPTPVAGAAQITAYIVAHHWAFPNDSDGSSPNFRLNSNGSIPIYWPQASDPAITITCTGANGNGICQRSLFPLKISIPSGAQPAQGSDAHMTVVDQASGTEYDFWQAKIDWQKRTMVVSSGCGLPVGVNSGSGLGGCARAAPTGLLGGIIRGPEIAAGKIDHALVLSVPCTRGYVWPATAGNGFACPGNDIGAPPLGALLQLTLTPEQISASGAPAWQQTIMNAMHTYGMYVVDTNALPNSIELDEENDLSFTSFGYSGPLGQGELGSAIEAAGGSFDEPDGVWYVDGVPLPITASDIQIVEPPCGAAAIPSGTACSR